MQTITRENYKNIDLKDLPNELWNDIKGYEGKYQVSNLGNVKSLERKIKNYLGGYGIIKERILKSTLNGRFYLMVTLLKNGNKKTESVHQLVAIAFHNHTPNGYVLVVNHKNFIRTDNRESNLEIVTMRENGDKKHLKSSSKYVGVHWVKRINKWQAQIFINDRQKYLGIFADEIQASNAYQKALNKLSNTGL